MSELRCEFAPELCARIDELARTLQEMLDAPDKAELGRSLAHKVHGTAGSYGFSEAAEIAGEIARALSQGPMERSVVLEAIGKLRAAKSGLSPAAPGGRS
jgi:hypothetical protein